jgi:hypothetical protein
VGLLEQEQEVGQLLELLEGIDLTVQEQVDVVLRIALGRYEGLAGVGVVASPEQTALVEVEEQTSWCVLADAGHGVGYSIKGVVVVVVRRSFFYYRYTKFLTFYHVSTRGRYMI